jgi:acetyl-CoA carboxylase alpha subunit
MTDTTSNIADEFNDQPPAPSSDFRSFMLEGFKTAIQFAELAEKYDKPVVPFLKETLATLEEKAAQAASKEDAPS